MMWLTGNHGEGARVAARGANSIPICLRYSRDCAQHQNQQKYMRNSPELYGYIRKNRQTIHTDCELLEKTTRKIDATKTITSQKNKGG
jgi:hypothetical protein